MNALLDAQDHRRLIKSHTPLDSIPYNPQSTYVTVHRDPRDVFLSMRHHMDNLDGSIFQLTRTMTYPGPFVIGCVPRPATTAA
ncbi:MAG: sulfotransferase domain-containing protein [Alphaproteobacteria bacterium]